MTEFISRNYGKEGYEIIIKTDSHDHYRATEEFARRLIDHAKPATNSDKIRDMTDNMDLIDIIKCPYTICQRTFTNCCECKLDWLQQPAEVENTQE